MVHHRVHNSLPLVPYTEPGEASRQPRHAISLRLILILNSNLRLRIITATNTTAIIPTITTDINAAATTVNNNIKISQCLFST